MYDVVKAIMWTAYLEFGSVLFIFWLISALTTAVTLKSYGVRWWLVGLVPFAHLSCKLYFCDAPIIRWWYGLIVTPIGLWAWLTVHPIVVLLYFVLCTAINWVYGLLMYNEGAMFATLAPYRYWKMLKHAFSERS